MAPGAGEAGGHDAILAVDVGTTELKAGLITRDGRLLGAARAGYPTTIDATSGAAEQDPEAWWAALRRVTGTLASSHGARVAAICGVGQGPTLVPADGNGEASRPAITWMDRRPSPEEGPLGDATGLSGWRLGVLPAARWMERFEPAAAARTRWYLNAWEWAAMRLTGVAATTRATGQDLPDPAAAARAGLAAERLPPLVAAGSVLGSLIHGAAQQLGLEAGIPVVAGTVDSFASFHGAGLTDAGQAVDTGGTSGGLAVYWDREPAVPGAWVARAPLPGRWIVGGAMTATGKALDWFASDVLGGVDPELLIREAAILPPGGDGLIFLPYLAGERSPIWDPLARGAFVGLSLAQGRGHLVRAILEAAAFALRHVATPILGAGLRIDELRVTGATASSEAWNQVKADVLGVPVLVPEVTDAALLGAAILAAPAVGWHADHRAAIEEMVRIDHRLDADAARKPAYDALFAEYVAAWPAIAPIVHRLHGPER